MSTLPESPELTAVGVLFPNKSGFLPRAAVDRLSTLDDIIYLDL